jgi:hypothetical protein
MLLAG